MSVLDDEDKMQEIIHGKNPNEDLLDYEKTDKTASIGLNLILRLVNQLGQDARIQSKNGIQVSFDFFDKKIKI